MKQTTFFALSALTLGVLIAPARAWWPQGHSLITAGAVRALPRDVPQFFKRNIDITATCAQDPDAFKNRELPQMTEAEAPDHFFDWEMLRGHALPSTRGDFLKLCAQLKINPQHVGYAPYSVAEWTQRLTVAFAQYRKSPNDAAIQAKTSVYAGILSHYAADLCMPLHVTIDFDGRAKPDGSSPKTGIHARIDSLPERLNLTSQQLARGQNIQPLSDLMTGIGREIEVSRAQIDASYSLGNQLPPEDLGKQIWKPSPLMRSWATARTREATRFTAALFLTAWRDSATLKLPSWWRANKTRF